MNVFNLFLHVCALLYVCYVLSVSVALSILSFMEFSYSAAVRNNLHSGTAIEDAFCSLAYGAQFSSSEIQAWPDVLQSNKQIELKELFKEKTNSLVNVSNELKELFKEKTNSLVDVSNGLIAIPPI